MRQLLKLFILNFLLMIIASACHRSNDFKDEIKDDSTEKENELENQITGCAVCEDIELLGWAVEFTLKPQADKSYLATEDLEIKALISKHGVEFRQTVEDVKYPELLPYYTLKLKGNCIICDESEETKEMRKNIINDFLATGKFEDHVREYEIVHGANNDEIIMCTKHNGILDYAVELTLKPQTDESYLATEDLEIKALVSKHGVLFRQSFPGCSSTFYPELLPYYTLTITGSCMCDESKETKEIRENIINDFLATGKFEDHVREFEIVYATND